MYGLGGKKQNRRNFTRRSSEWYGPSTSRYPALFPSLSPFARRYAHGVALEMKCEAGVGMQYVKSGETLMKHRSVPLKLRSCVTFVKRTARSTQYYVKEKKPEFIEECNNITFIGLRPTFLEFRIRKERSSKSSTITGVKRVL